ncbi:protein SRC2 homolog [Impatiens glandulifera]|uniref:protein SRC2 homolog n=1 Tax=Impatiens glandulifera TaxID=253017 RepID=UPI001FB06FE4|nr:protein SRC2 homolog [Impatiens glandulifera]
MGSRQLELNIVSAKGLKDIGIFSKMDVYVAVTINGDPCTEQKTPVDEDGGSSPKWSHPMKFVIEESMPKGNHLNLFFRLRHERVHFGDKDVGEVHVSVKELLDKSSIGDNVNAILAEFPVRSTSGKQKGKLKFSYKFGPSYPVRDIPVFGLYPTSVTNPYHPSRPLCPPGYHAVPGPLYPSPPPVYPTALGPLSPPPTGLHSPPAGYPTTSPGAPVRYPDNPGPLAPPPTGYPSPPVGYPTTSSGAPERYPDIPGPLAPSPTGYPSPLAWDPTTSPDAPARYPDIPGPLAPPLTRYPSPGSYRHPPARYLQPGPGISRTESYSYPAQGSYGRYPPYGGYPSAPPLGYPNQGKPKK